MTFQVQISFLFVGHTHEDVDQLFSLIAELLRMMEAFTPQALKELLPNCSFLRGLLDYRAWMEPNLMDVKNHSQTGMFRLRLCPENEDDVDIFYRKTSSQPWKIIKGSIFKKDEAGRSIRPTGTPNPVLADFGDKHFDIPSLRKSLCTWRKYFPTGSEAGHKWEDWLNKVEILSKNKDHLKTYSSQDVEHLLDTIPPYREADVPNLGDAKEQMELENLALSELQNPQVMANAELYSRCSGRSIY